MPVVQRSPNLLDVGQNSQLYQRPRAGLFSVLKKKQKQKATGTALVTFVH